MTDDDATGTMINDLGSITGRLADLVDSAPSIAGNLTSAAIEIAEVRGFIDRGSIHIEELATLRRLKNAVGFLINAIEAPGRGGAGTEIRELLADLMELAWDDDHGTYPTAPIDDLRKRARKLLVDG